MEITCKECGEVFAITEAEQKWYEDKGLKLPKRCSACRKARRKNRVGGKNESTEV